MGIILVFLFILYKYVILRVWWVLMYPTILLCYSFFLSRRNVRVFRFFFVVLSARNEVFVLQTRRRNSNMRKCYIGVIKHKFKLKNSISFSFIVSINSLNISNSQTQKPNKNWLIMKNERKNWKRSQKWVETIGKLMFPQVRESHIVWLNRVIFFSTLLSIVTLCHS